MLKRFLTLIVVIAFVIVCVCGCNGDKSQSAQKQIDETPDYVDKTVKIESCNPDNFSVDVTSTSTIVFETLYKNKGELYDDATNVVYGTVKDIAYFDESGAAMILYDFAIEEVYKGSLNQNDMISILADGGYVRLSKYVELYGKERFSNYSDEQIKKAVIAYDNMGMPTPEIGDKYLLFLSPPIDNEPPFPNGAYVELGSFMGRYVEQGSEFIRYKPANEPDFYLGGEERISKAEAKTYLVKEKEEIK